MYEYILKYKKEAQKKINLNSMHPIPNRNEVLKLEIIIRNFITNGNVYTNPKTKVKLHTYLFYLDFKMANKVKNINTEDYKFYLQNASVNLKNAKFYEKKIKGWNRKKASINRYLNKYTNKE